MAFIAVLGKQWIVYFTRPTVTWGNIVDRGKGRQEKLLGLRKWRLHLIMVALPVMLQFALLLFGIALTVYLWDLDVTAAEVVLVVTSAGLIFYGCIMIAATVDTTCPFQTPLSILLLEVPGLLSRKAMTLLRQIERPTKYNYLVNFLKHAFKIPVGGATPQALPDGDIPKFDYPMTLSNPAFWRRDPLFNSPIQKDIRASAGFWLLENSTDFSAATAVAAVFHQFQWPSHHPSTTALVRLRDTYAECFRVPDSTTSSRIKALQTAAAYYVLYHTQLIWSTWKSLEVETEKLPADLPRDLFLGQYNEEWDRKDVFEYLLHVNGDDRSEPVKSARFLSYLAPYWFCGDSDDAIRFRPRHFPTLNELVKVLENSGALDTTTLTDCILCAGAAMDFPLHPEDLIRVDKRCVPHSSCAGGRFDWVQPLFYISPQGGSRTYLSDSFFGGSTATLC